MLILNFIVLLFEILFYSMFMYYSKREGKFNRYLLLFSLITIFFTFVGTTQLISYVVLIFMMLYGIKHIVKVKTTLYDMFILSLMLIFKIVIEFIVVLLFYNLFGIIITTFILLIAKLLITFTLKNKLNIFYKKMRIIWYKNNFYIRYIFSCLIVIYIIFSALALINY